MPPGVAVGRRLPTSRFLWPSRLCTKGNGKSFQAEWTRSRSARPLARDRTQHPMSLSLVVDHIVEGDKTNFHINEGSSSHDHGHVSATGFVHRLLSTESLLNLL